MLEKKDQSRAPLSLSERIRISNETSAEAKKEIARFHRVSSFFRPSRFGFDLSYGSEDSIRREISTRQIRLSEKEISKIGPFEELALGSTRRGESIRSFAASERGLDFKILSQILFHSYCERLGEKESAPYPSAGGAYSVNVVLLPTSKFLNAPFCEDSILHVGHHDGALYLLKTSGAEECASMCLNCIPGAWPKSHINASFFVVYVIDLELSALDFEERGYRFSLIEAGAMAQQATLIARNFGLDCCLHGKFPDAELSLGLGLNPKKMLSCLVQIFGKSQ